MREPMIDLEAGLYPPGRLREMADKLERKEPNI